MKNEIKVYEEKPDWFKVIDLALNREGWGKTYTLYNVKDVFVKCVLREYNFVRNDALFHIWVEYPNQRTRWIAENLVNYPMNHFTLEDFNRILKRRVLKLLDDVEEYETSLNAKEAKKDLKFDLGNIEKDDIEDCGYLDEYKAISDMQDSALKSELLSAFYEKVLEVLNEGYDDEVAIYEKDNPVVIDGFGDIRSRLRK